METTTSNHKQQELSADPVYLESTLMRVFGVLFCHDPKRARARTGTVEINRGVAEKGIIVRFDPEYAQPGPFAHKVALAIIRKHSRLGTPAKNSVSFSQSELNRMIGRTSMGGRQSEQLVQALKQIRYTHVIAHFKQGDRFVEHDFSIFNEVLIERRATPSDPIVACTITIADPIITSLNDKHFTCLNHALLQECGTIAAALYMRLFHHFSTHYDGHHLDRVVFKKRYDDICAEWLGGITVLKHRSKILGEQLGTHLNQLVALGFLRSYALTPAEGRDGFVLTFRAGEQFKSDYSAFYTRPPRRESRFTFHDEDREVGLAHKVAYLFQEKLSGRKPDAGAYVSSKDAVTAKELLTHIDFEDISDFIDYALREAGKTRFDLRTLGGVRQYLNGYTQVRQQQAAAQKAAAGRREAERDIELRDQYEAYREQQARRLMKALPEAEQADLEVMARNNLSAKGPLLTYMAPTLIRCEKLRLVIEKYGSDTQTFEQWREAQAH